MTTAVMTRSPPRIQPRTASARAISRSRRACCPPRPAERRPALITPAMTATTRMWISRSTSDCIIRSRSETSSSTIKTTTDAPIPAKASQACAWSSTATPTRPARTRRWLFRPRTAVAFTSSASSATAITSCTCRSPNSGTTSRSTASSPSTRASMATMMSAKMASIPARHRMKASARRSCRCIPASRRRMTPVKAASTTRRMIPTTQRSISRSISASSRPWASETSCSSIQMETAAPTTAKASMA